MANKQCPLIALLALALCLLAAPRGSGAPGDGPGQRPYLGWSSWSLEATKAPGYGGMDWPGYVTTNVLFCYLHQLRRNLEETVATG